MRIGEILTASLRLLLNLHPKTVHNHFAWVINQYRAPLEVFDPVLKARQSNEVEYIQEVARHSDKIIVMPWKYLNLILKARNQKDHAGKIQLDCPKL